MRLREESEKFSLLAIILCIVRSVFCVLVVVGYWYRCSSVCFKKKKEKKKRKTLNFVKLKIASKIFGKII